MVDPLLNVLFAMALAMAVCGQAFGQQPDKSDATNRTGVSRAGFESATDNSPIPGSPAPREIASQILNRSLMEAVWGKPVLCEVRQTIRMFDKKRNSFGKYVRGGQGSGKLRLSLQVPGGDQMNSLLQVSDGELLSTLLNVGSHATRTQVDLGKIRDRLTITADSLQDPVLAMYLAVGGQAELLRKLCQQYEWTKVSEGKLGQQRVWWLSGQAAEQPMQVRSMALIDVRLFEKRPGFQPWRASIAIGHVDSEAPFWLYQVEETFQEDSAEPSRLEVTTEWDSPVVLTASQLVPELFRLGAADSQSLYESRDETIIYLPPSTASMAGAMNSTSLQR